MIGDPPILSLALEQHRTYMQTLESLGLSVLELEPDDWFPDSTFVEDVAVLAGPLCILTRPGAPDRRGETGAILPLLESLFPVERIIDPGTLDGGDVCQTDREFLIGVSQRTNVEGARQLQGHLERAGYRAGLLDLAGRNLLHLKSGLSYLGENRLLVSSTLAHESALAKYECLVGPEGEDYATNCVRIRDRVLVPSGFPKTLDQLAALELDPIPLDCSEFQKMDGGLSCLSLRY